MLSKYLAKDANAVQLAVRISAVGFLASAIISFPLWLSADRFFPLVPLFPGLPSVPAPLDGAQYCLLLVTLTAICLMPSAVAAGARPAGGGNAAGGVKPLPYRIATSLAIVQIIVLMIFDQLRWQPWAYEYLVVFCVAAFSKDSLTARRSLQLMVAFVYIWSGIQKFNASYATDLFPWLISGLIPTLGALTAPCAFGSAVIEMLSGFGLLFPRTRRVAASCLVGMHASILIFIGPLTLNWNHVVWPWNLAMMALILVLYFWDADTKPLEIVLPKAVPHGIVFALFAVLPLLNYWGAWDNWLSMSLYSGKIPRAFLEFDEQSQAKLPPELRNLLHVREKLYRIVVQEWSTAELHALPYPEERVYKSIGSGLARRLPPDVEYNLVILQRPQSAFTVERPVVRYSREQLAK